MANPNRASGKETVVRRGKERAAPKKKKLNPLKKLILRERLSVALADATEAAATAAEEAERGRGAHREALTLGCRV